MCIVFGCWRYDHCFDQTGKQDESHLEDGVDTGGHGYYYTLLDSGFEEDLLDDVLVVPQNYTGAGAQGH